MQATPKRFLLRLLGFERARPGERRLKTILLHALRGTLAQATGQGLVSCFSEVPKDEWQDKIQGSERGFWESVAKGEVSHEAWHHLDPETLVWFGLDAPAFDDAVAMDLGCGPRGVLAGFRHGNKIFVDSLLHEYRKLGLVQPETGAGYVTGEGERLPFKNASVNLVLCTNALDHMQRPVQVVEDIHRVLKPGGQLFVQVFYFERLLLGPGSGHPFDFTYRDVKQLLKGFRTVKEINSLDGYTGLLEKPG